MQSYATYTWPWQDPNSCWSPPWMRQAAAYQQPPPQHQASCGYYNNAYYAYEQRQPQPAPSPSYWQPSSDYNYAYYAYGQPPATYVPLTDLEIREELQSIRDDFRSILKSFRSLVENLLEQERNGASDLSESELKIDTNVGDAVNIAPDVTALIVDVAEVATVEKTPCAIAYKNPEMTAAVVNKTNWDDAYDFFAPLHQQISTLHPHSRSQLRAAKMISFHSQNTIDFLSFSYTRSRKMFVFYRRVSRLVVL